MTVYFLFFAFSRPSPAPAVAGRVRDTVFPAPGSQQRLSNYTPRAVRVRQSGSGAPRAGVGGRGGHGAGGAPAPRIFKTTLM